jgi:ATP diphosphatase
VVDAVTTKMIRRHPHVFGDADGNTATAVRSLWEDIKAQERSAKAAAKTMGGEAVSPPSALDGVPLGMPALTRALKLQEKAGRVGFDWNDPRAVLAKIREEADEIEAELDRDDQSKAGAEAGDLLFAVVNLARHLGADPEGILRATNSKFERRFKSIERALAALGKGPKDATLAEMDALWEQAKAEEKS